MTTVSPIYHPTQTLLTGSPTDAQLRQYLGELTGCFNRMRQISPLLDTRNITFGSSWQSPAYGHMEAPKYHVLGDDVLRTAGYMSRIPFKPKVYMIDDPLLSNGFVSDFTEFQSHYSGREPWLEECAEGHVIENDTKAVRMLIKAARADANLPLASLSARTCTPPGSSSLNTLGNTAPASSSNAAMQTSSTVLLAALQGVAQQAMEREIDASKLTAAILPQQYFNLVNDRQLLDRDVLRTPGQNGSFDDGTVYKAFGIKLMPSTALKAVIDTGNYAGVTGENNSYIADFSKNRGIVFSSRSVQRLVRLPMEFQMWYEKACFGNVTTSRVIDGYGIKLPETTFELSIP